MRVVKDDRVLAGLLPEGDLPLRLSVEPGGPRTGDQPDTVDTAVRVGVSPSEGAAPFAGLERFAVTTRVFDGEGRLEVSALTEELTSAPSIGGDVELTSRLSLKPGRYNVRVAMN